MGIKRDSKRGGWRVLYSKRHPITRKPITLKRVGIKTLAEAKRIYNELVIEVERKLHEEVTPKWEQVISEYIDDCHSRGLTLKTIENYRTCLQHNTYSKWSDRSIDDITTLEIRSLVLDDLANFTQNHQRNVFKTIRGVFHFAVEAGYLQTNPSPQIKFRMGDKIKKVLTEPQVRQLLDKAKEMNCEWYYHWAMAVYTGMRNGELYALTWDRVNFDNGTILVNESWNSKDGFKSTKSGDDRVIDIAPTLLTLLKELKLAHEDHPFVLPRLHKWSKGEQARELRMFLMGIGLPPVRFHDLRATWATILLSKGVEPIKVMSAGGWKGLKTMMIYVRKAGVDIRGMSTCLDLHNPCRTPVNVVKMEDGRPLSSL